MMAQHEEEVVMEEISTSSVEAEQPVNVYALDLKKLSLLVGCSEAELLTNMHTNEAVEMEGVVVDRGAPVPFEAVGQTQSQQEEEDKKPPKLVHQVLLTAAYRASSLGSFSTPKCLLRVGGKTIIQHILNQLYLAQIGRVVISVALKGDEIIKNVRESPLFDKMNIEFVDLGEDYTDGHARSILAMKSVFNGQPFMIHTSDHIFDNKILSKMLSFRLLSAAACVLIETNFEGIVGTLPSTAVKVKMTGTYVDEIGRDVEPYDGIDAGLFIVTSRLFSALEDLARRKSYFSLSEALDIFAGDGLLRYTITGGNIWFSFETKKQLDYSREHTEDPVLSPWTVFVAHPPRNVERAETIDLAPKNLMIGVASTDHETSLHVVGDDSSPDHVISGFVVEIEHTAESTMADEGTSLISKKKSQLSSADASLIHRTQLAGERVEDRDHHDPYVLSIPWEETQVNEYIDTSHEALLIEVSEYNKATDESSHKYMLAVPDTTVQLPVPSITRSLTTLPTDITNIHLEATEIDKDIEVTIVVDRSVPLIGFVLLLSALLTISSVGAAMDLQTNVSPILKLFWRMSATAIAFFPVAWLSLFHNGIPTVDKKKILTLFLCGCSYAYFCGAFIVALDLTSVGHAYIFNNSHSIIIVFGKMLFREPIVLLEAIGAGMGVLGGFITTLDTSASSDVNVVGPSVKGDLIALSGAVAGVLYLTSAKKLRSTLDLPVFMFFITFWGSTILLLAMTVVEPDFTFDVHVNTGLFGWLVPISSRLPIELYLVFICNFIGTMGYIGVMKYFDPIVVSVVMLTEPLIATAMGILVGVSSWPGIYTYSGALVVIFGTYLVVSSAKKKTQEIDACDAIRIKSPDGVGIAESQSYHLAAHGKSD